MAIPIRLRSGQALNRSIAAKEAVPINKRPLISKCLGNRDRILQPFRDQNHVFKPHSAQPGIVQAGLRPFSTPIFLNYFLQTRMLVDFQSQDHDRYHEKSHAPALANLGRKPAVGEKFLDRVVNRHSIKRQL